MKAYDFINLNIGKKVYLLPDGDLGMSSNLKLLIHYETPLTLLGLTKGGMAKVQEEENGNIHIVPPRNVRLIGT